MLSGQRYEIDFEDFEQKIKQYHPTVFLLINPHNPTGRVFTQEELDRMVTICAANGVRIISDEVHFLVTFDGHRHIPILAVSEKARKISVQIFSFSKGFNISSSATTRRWSGMCWLPAQSSDLYDPRFSILKSGGFFCLRGRKGLDNCILQI